MSKIEISISFDTKTKETVIVLNDEMTCVSSML